MTDINVFSAHLSVVPDFRKPQGKRYQFHHLLTLMVLGMLSGCDDFESLELFCKKKAEFLINHGLLDGKNYPSHDLFRWIMLHIDKSVFSHLLSSWLESMEMLPVEVPQEEKRLIHIDGKVLRGTRTGEHKKTALTLLGAYCSQQGVSVGQLLISKKSCEKAAIPYLIDFLDLRYCVVTIDAVGTMSLVARQIVDKKGDYILALKKNNKLFFNEVSDFFHHFSDTQLIVDVAQSIDNQGRRTDIRTCSIMTDLRFFPDAQNWKNLKTLVYIKSQRTIQDKSSIEERFYLSSLDQNASELMAAIRRHWSIENELHWHLDVAFNEDKLRLKEKNATFCMAALRRFALTLLKKSDSKESIKHQRLALAWNGNELFNVLNINSLYFS
jgi:predicted transposase YbfD/YdcC